MTEREKHSYNALTTQPANFDNDMDDKPFLPFDPVQIHRFTFNKNLLSTVNKLYNKLQNIFFSNKTCFIFLPPNLLWFLPLVLPVPCSQTAASVKVSETKDEATQPSVRVKVKSSDGAELGVVGGVSRKVEGK